MKKIFLSLCVVLLVAASLSAQEEQTPKKVGLPIFLNFLPGFGIGSFVEGDTIGGVVLLAADMVSIVLVGIPIVTAIGSVLWGMVTFQWAIIGEGVSIDETLVISGMIVYLASKVLGVVLPILFANDYNARLEKKKIAFHIAPWLDESVYPGGMTAGIRLNIRYSAD